MKSQKLRRKENIRRKLINSFKKNEHFKKNKKYIVFMFWQHHLFCDEQVSIGVTIGYLIADGVIIHK